MNVHLSDIKQRVDQLGSAWEQFKSVNNRRLGEIERKGSADPLTTEQLKKVNHALDEYKDRLSTLETVMHRPSASAEHAVLTIRYLEGLTTKMRLRLGDRLFNIRAILNREERNEMLELTVEEGVAQ